MKLTIEIEVPISISKDKKHFIVYSHSAFNQLVGTSAGASNARLYNAVKDKSKNQWSIPIEEVRKRETELQVKIDDLSDKISFMKKVLKKVK